MGICPCNRDKNTAAEGSKTTARSNVQGHLPPAASIFHLSSSFSSHYRLLQEVQCEAGPKQYLAERLCTAEHCVVTVIEKTVERGSDPPRASLCALRHPYILQTYELYEDESYLYSVTEAVKYPSLAKYLSGRSGVSEEMAGKVGYQVLSALVLAHSSGLVHTQLSPDTVFLCAHEPAVKVGGFELGRAPCPDSLRVYCAPEVTEGGTHSDKSDVWSCGVLLYELLSGDRPFVVIISPTSGRRKYKGFSFPPIVWSQVDRRAVVLITAMLRKDPAARPSTMQCFVSQWIQKHAQGLFPPSYVQKEGGDCCGRQQRVEGSEVQAGVDEEAGGQGTDRRSLVLQRRVPVESLKGSTQDKAEAETVSVHELKRFCVFPPRPRQTGEAAHRSKAKWLLQSGLLPGAPVAGGEGFAGAG